MVRSRDTAFFGHPLGLATLFFTEMWERFSYYGIRALLILYMTAKVSAGGREMTVPAAGAVMAVYLSSVYLLSLPGGWIADRFLGQRKATLIGGIGIAAGNAVLALPIDSFFFPGLVMIALGTGMLKPNISTIVGQLYHPNDARRDGGYTIYYMGINIGALVAPLACGYFAQSESFQGFLRGHGIDPGWCWHFGFATASVGMILGVVQYVVTTRWLGDAGAQPTIPADPRRAARDRYVLAGIVAALVLVGVLFATAGAGADTIVNIFGVGLIILSIALFIGLFQGAHNAGERRRMVAILVLFIGAIAFFGIFEQASTTLSLFAEKYTTRELLGIAIPASYYQSVNSIFIITLAPVFAWLWLFLARHKKEPMSVMKFAIGMALIAVSFIVMLPTLSAVKAGQTSSGIFLIMLYFFSTCSELCISPVGLSSMSKLAPKRLAGMVMGVWFLGAANGNYLAGRAAEFTVSKGYEFLFYALIISALAVAAGLFLVAPVIRRMMSVDDAAPAPVDIPVARVVTE
ncbi:MAG TPA: peptide MFS transporter [Kofleriaceae bacterium]|nr:peptide MFS transporter [Kofleriaceae bacterium]